MKKLSVIMFCILLIMIGCTEKRVPSDSLTNVKKTVLPSELTEIGGYQYYQGELFTGMAVFDATNEYGRGEDEYVNGRLVEYRKYHLNGQIKKLSSFNANGDYTVFQEFNEEGQLKREVNFVDGKQVSETKY